MKENFIIVVILTLLISGCSIKHSDQKTMVNENEAKGADSSQNDAIGRLNDIKNGLTPVVKPTGKSSVPAEGQGGQAGQEGQQQIQLENLTAQYNQAVIKTNFGDIKVAFYAQESPVTVNNFINLAKIGFYNGVKFHRVIKDFMIQGGDPLSKDDDPSNDGTGGPGYKFQDEINGHKLVRGSLAMANSGPNTNGSQFFIVTDEATPWLDGKHTNFGQVIDGMDIVDKIEAVRVSKNSYPNENIIIENIELIKAASENNANAENAADRGEENIATTSEDSKQ